MANHGKTGAALDMYHSKRRNKRVISGAYVSGGQDKRTVLTRNKLIRENNRRGKDNRHYSKAVSKGR